MTFAATPYRDSGACGVDRLDMMELFRTLRRRWLLTSLLLIVSLGGAATLAARPGPYQAKSEVTLLPSRQLASTCGGNPYLCLSASLTLTADLVNRQVSDPSTAAYLASRGYTGSYALVDDPSTSGPVIDITVTGNNKSIVENTLRGVTNEVATKLAQMQAGIRSVDQITSLRVYFDPRPALVIKKKARLPVVALAVGLLLTAAVPQIVDRLLRGRRSRVATRVSERAARERYASDNDYVTRSVSSRAADAGSYPAGRAPTSGDASGRRPVTAQRPGSSPYGRSR